MMPDYEQILHFLMAHGREVIPRGLKTQESVGLAIEFIAGETVTRPRYNPRLAWAELLQLIGGVFREDVLKAVAPKASHDLFTPQMAYGPKVRDQLPHVIDALRRDPSTRRAVLYLGDGAIGPTQDQPCTESIQFLRRVIKGEEVLLTVVSMRSWDAVRGLPYDIVMFGGLAMAVASVLGVKAGLVRVTAGSLHIYETDQWVFDSPGHPPEPGVPFILSLDYGTGDWETVRASALRQLEDAPWAAREGWPLGITSDEEDLNNAA